MSHTTMMTTTTTTTSLSSSTTTDPVVAISKGSSHSASSVLSTSTGVSSNDGDSASSSSSCSDVRLEEARNLYHRGKELLHKRTDLPGAVACFQQAVKLKEAVLGKYHVQTLTTYHRLGRAQWLCQQPASALLSWKRSVRLSAAAMNEEPLLLLDSSSSNNTTQGAATTATTTTDDDNQDESPPADTTTNATNSTLLWQDILNFIQEHPPVLSSNNNNEKGNTVNFEVILQESFSKAILESLQSERQGDAFCKKQKLEKALEQYERSLQLEREALAMIAPDIFLEEKETSPSSSSSSDFLSLDGADVTCKMALLHRLLGSAEISRELYTKAHQVYQASLPEDHPAIRGAAAQIQLSSSNNDTTTTMKEKKSGWGKLLSPKKIKKNKVKKGQDDGLPAPVLQAPTAVQ